MTDLKNPEVNDMGETVGQSEFGKALCAAVGIDPNQCTELSIHVTPRFTRAEAMLHIKDAGRINREFRRFDLHPMLLRPRPKVG